LFQTALAELEAVLKPTMHDLHHLSEQLDPLESAYSDVRFFDVDVDQTQQQFEVIIFAKNQNSKKLFWFVETLKSYTKKSENLAMNSVLGLRFENFEKFDNHNKFAKILQALH
jgi:hypothetical protein